MATDDDRLERVTAIAADLESAGCNAVLVGGMALVILGSRRVTDDFDLVVSKLDLPADEMVKIMYRHNLRLITKLSPEGDVVRTVDNARVARAKVKMEPFQSLFFHDPKSGLRVDLLFDFPLPARELEKRAMPLKLPSGRLRVAAPEDLLRLKEIAYADRKHHGDAQDLEFLRTLIGRRSS